MKYKLMKKIFMTCVVLGIFIQMLNLNSVSADSGASRSSSFSGNALNGGLATTLGSDIYFSNQGDLGRLYKNSNGYISRITNEPASNIAASGEKVFYSMILNGRTILFCYNTVSGEQSQLLSVPSQDGIINIEINGDSIYYKSAGVVFKYCSGISSRIILSDSFVSSFIVSDNKIVFAAENDSYTQDIFEYDLLNGKCDLIIPNTIDYDLSGTIIYYADLTSKSLCTYDRILKTNKIVVSKMTENIIASEKNIFFLESNSHKIYRYNETTDKIILVETNTNGNDRYNIIDGSVFHDLSQIMDNSDFELNDVNLENMYIKPEDTADFSIQYSVSDTLSTSKYVPNITGEYKSWKQFDSRWGKMAMPGGGDLAAYGCVITSSAILTVHARLTDESKMDPGKLLTFLKNNDGLTNSGGIYWTKISLMVPNFEYVSSINLSGSDSEKIKKIKSYVDSGYYVIPNVNSGGHFVAVDTYIGDSIVMMDPGSNSKNNLFRDYYSSGIIGLRVFSAPNLPPPGTVNDLITSWGEEHWAAGCILSLSSKGIMSGYTDGTYRPDNTITRAEVIKMLTVAYAKYDSAADYDKFTDVKKSQWYYSYVASAVNSGIADSNGIGNEKFGPDSAITRESMITFIARCLAEIDGYFWLSDSAVKTELDIFSDNSKISSWAKASVALCVRNGIVNGYSDSNGVLTFKPGNNMKRGEVAKVVNSIL